MRAYALVAVGATLVVAGLMTVVWPTWPPDFGAPPAEHQAAPEAPGQPRGATPAPTPPPAPPASESEQPASERLEGTQAPNTSDARLRAQTSIDSPAPIRLTVPAISADATVVPVGVETDTGEMEIPADVTTVGWYRHGAAPGDTRGTALLVAHVDDRRQGRGVFFELTALREGDEVSVEGTDGRAHTYIVVARRQTPKSELPPELFDRDGPHRLALITCGGEFDPERRSYRDNVSVIAEPVDS